MEILDFEKKEKISPLPRLAIISLTMPIVYEGFLIFWPYLAERVILKGLQPISWYLVTFLLYVLLALILGLISLIRSNEFKIISIMALMLNSIHLIRLGISFYRLYDR